MEASLVLSVEHSNESNATKSDDKHELKLLLLLLAENLLLFSEGEWPFYRPDCKNSFILVLRAVGNAFIKIICGPC